MDISKYSSENFPKWHICAEGDFPENYNINKSKSGFMYISDTVLAMQSNNRGVKILCIARFSVDNGFTYNWGGIKAISSKGDNNSINGDEILMWTYPPSQKYLLSKYKEICEMHKEIGEV